MKGELEPLFDRVVVKRDEAKKKVGNIFLPDNAQQTSYYGTVVAVGPGEDGKAAPRNLKKGARVMMSKYSGHVHTNEDGSEFVVLNFDDILAVVGA